MASSGMAILGMIIYIIKAFICEKSKDVTLRKEKKVRHRRLLIVDDQIMGPDCLKLEAVKQPFRCNILLGLYLFHCSLSLHFPPNPI